jgi:hypothetical protein
MSFHQASRLSYHALVNFEWSARTIELYVHFAMFLCQICKERGLFSLGNLMHISQERKSSWNGAGIPILRKASCVLH